MITTITIPANSTASLQVSGRVIACLAAATSFQVQRDNQHREQMGAGDVIGEPGARPFHRLTFYETSGTALDVTIYAGDTDYRPNVSTSGSAPSLTKEAPSYFKGSNATSIGATTSVTVVGTDSGRQRKMLIVQNLDGTNSLYVRDTSDRELDTVLPGETKAYPVSGTVKIRNPNANPVNCRYGEIYYL